MESISRYARLFVILIACAFATGSWVFADEYNSASYKVLDPVFAPSIYGTSASYRLWGSMSELAVGTSTATSYRTNAGFLFYPFMSTPVLTATAGDTSVGLTWTSASASLGWTVGGYTVGQSTVSGGPYAYTFVGPALSAFKPGLTNGTAYYFVIRVQDMLGNFIATSTQVSATPAAPSVTPYSQATYGGGGGGGGGGGSGGGIVSTGPSTVNFSGRAYPGSTVTLLKDAQVAASTVAGSDAMFTVNLGSLTAGNYLFSLYTEDKNGNRSSLLTFPVGATVGATTNIGGIFLAPTIATDKSQVKKGDNIAIFGQSAVNADVTIVVNSDQEYFGKVRSDTSGVYLYNFDTSVLENGDHTTKAKSAAVNEISQYGKAVGFKVGDQNVAAGKNAGCTKRGDMNNDCRVNLVDFSIAAYWYKRANPPAKVDLNGDGKVNLIDFSIMAYNWTG